MKPHNVKIGTVELGKQTKIAVPLIEKTAPNLLAALPHIVKAQPDLVEWRLDYYEHATDIAKINALGNKLQQNLAGIPLLVTFRTNQEGGLGNFNAADYEKLLIGLAKQSWVDALDIEWQQAADDLLVRLNKPTILSQHHFTHTPPLETLISTLTHMGNTPATVVKLAVMPKNAVDVANLLKATAVANQFLTQPLITMSMGKLGKISRISGNVFGSAVTFATVDQASAPGQLPIEQVRKLLNEFTS